MALVDAVASAKARVEVLNASIQEQRTKKQEYAAIISQQSLGNSLPSLPYATFLLDAYIFICIIFPSGCSFILYSYLI